MYPINMQVNGEEDGAAFILMVSLKMSRVYYLHHYAASTPSDGDGIESPVPVLLDNRERPL